MCVSDVWRATPLTGRTLLSSALQDFVAHVSTLGLHHLLHALHYHNQASLYFILFSLPHFLLYHSQTNARLCGLLYLAGAHIQVNEKWQLCTLFAIQHLPRPPVGQKEGELHSLTMISAPHLTWCNHSFCVPHIGLILFYHLINMPGL